MPGIASLFGAIRRNLGIHLNPFEIQIFARPPATPECLEAPCAVVSASNLRLQHAPDDPGGGKPARTGNFGGSGDAFSLMAVAGMLRYAVIAASTATMHESIQTNRWQV
jgi:hypothetical protein